VVQSPKVPDMSSGLHRPRALPPTTRASVSFPTDVYAELERIAAAKKVSLAWVVREAAEKYVADQWPLLASATEGRHP
jgi:predicted transcriptional regulator